MAHSHEHGHEHSHEHGAEHEHTCSCGCSHEEGESSRMILRIVLTVVSFAAVKLLEKGPLSFIGTNKVTAVLLYAVPYLIIGYDVLWRALKNILHGEVFDENFLMSVATIGAMILGEYTEATAVMLFYQIGEALQDYAGSEAALVKERILASAFLVEAQQKQEKDIYLYDSLQVIICTA